MAKGGNNIVRICFPVIFFIAFLMCGDISRATAPESHPAGDGLPLALRSAVALHPSIRSKLEELKALGFDLESAQAKRYPTFSLQASSANDMSGNATVTSTSDRADKVLAVAKQPIWVGGRISGGIDQAEIKQHIGSLAVLATQRQIMEETAASYAAILGARKRLAAAQDNVREHLQLQERITRRQTGGVASESDIQLASSRVSQAVAQQLQLEGSLDRALNDLHALTQQYLLANEEVPVKFTQLPNLDKIPAEVEAMSATVRQRITEVDLARTNAELAKSDMMPSLYATVEQDVVSSTSHGEDLLGTRVGAVLEGNLDGLGFSGWKKVQSSESRIGAAKRDVETAKNEVQRTVKGLLTDLRSNERVLQSNEQLVQSTRQTLDSFLRQYEAGRKTWLDVLNTLRDLASARLELEQNRATLLATQLRLAVQCGSFDQLVGVTP